MAKTPRNPVLDVIGALEDRLDQQARALAEISAHLRGLHDDVRRSMEVVTRLKLAGDNARVLARAQGETLDRIKDRLAGIERRLPAARPATRRARAAR